MPRPWVRHRALALLLVLAAGPARADMLELPAVMERTGRVAGIYRVDPPRDGGGTLTLEWTDSLGRVVQRSTQPADGNAVPISLDLTRAVAMRNRLAARLDRGGATSGAELGFIARPPLRNWDDFRIVMYQDQNPPALAGLRELGVSAVRIFGHRVPFTPADVAARVGPAVDANLQWYVENIATDFYSPYHMWTPEHPTQVHWLFLEAQARHQRDPADLSVFERSPSLSDRGWIANIGERLADHVRTHGAFRPLYYSLGDEPGIADLAAAWDFDRAPVALAAFRDWLRVRYGSLAALNAMWGSRFAAWDAVVPEGTTAAMARTDDNFSAWNDHKAFMDASFGAALRAGTEAVHAADPAALAGIEGGQIPGWGGWDYGQVAPAVDVMEIYEAGQNIEIARSLNPKLVTLATGFASGAPARRQIWRAAMQGAGGLILWDEENGVVRPDGTAGPRGISLAPTFDRLAGGLGALLLASPPLPSQVAVLYSPASFRLRWLLDHRAAGDAWTQRSSELENQDNAVRAAMRDATAALATMGVTPRWMTAEQVAAGALAREGMRVLVLPGVMALSDGEAAAITGFAAAGGAVLSTGETGTFDGHLRRRDTPALGDFVRAVRPDGWSNALLTSFAATGTRPPLALPEAMAAPAVTIRHHGAVRLVGIQAAQPGAAPLRMELGPAFTGVRYVRDLLGNEPWRELKDATFALDADGTALLAFSWYRPSPPEVTAPGPTHAGTTAAVRLRLETDGMGPPAVLRVELRDPQGRLARAYSGNVKVPVGPAGRLWTVPFAVNDPPGDWTLSVHDPLGGSTATRTIPLLPP